MDLIEKKNVNANQSISLQPNANHWHRIVGFSLWTYVFSDWFVPFSIAYAPKIQRNVHVLWVVVCAHWFFFHTHTQLPIYQLIFTAINEIERMRHNVANTTNSIFRLMSFVRFFSASFLVTGIHKNAQHQFYFPYTKHTRDFVVVASITTVMPLHTLSLHSFHIWRHFFPHFC